MPNVKGQEAADGLGKRDVGLRNGSGGGIDDAQSLEGLPALAAIT